jgi:hypothetical protein
MKSRCSTTRLFCTVFLVVLLSVARAEDGLYALVFGNDEYSHMGKLPSAAADARLFASHLKRCGFSLPFGNDTEQSGASLNLTREQMQAQILQLRSSGVLSRASVVVFYFAGHGGQVNDEVYVLGTGAVVERGHETSDLEKSGLSLRSIASDLKPKAGKGLITVVDACRLGQKSGASSGVDDEDVLAVFSTSAGKAAKSGANGGPGVFTRTLVGSLARQQTWNEAISAARVAAQNAHGQQPKASYDPTGPLASFRMAYTPPSAGPVSNSQPSIQGIGNYPSRVQLTAAVKKTLTLRDSPSGKEIGNIFQNMDDIPFANCDPAGVVEKDGLKWLPVRCSGWVLQEKKANGKHYIKVELSQFTVVNHPDHASVNLRYRSTLAEKSVLDLRPRVTGTALSQWTTQEGFDWRMVQVDGWVLLESREGQRYVTF